MSWLSNLSKANEEQAPLPEAVTQGSEPEEKAEEPMPPYGKKFGRLTQFGGSWIDLDRVAAIDFTVDEEYDSIDIQFDFGDSFSIPSSDARALKVFLERGF